MLDHMLKYTSFPEFHSYCRTMRKFTAVIRDLPNVKMCLFSFFPHIQSFPSHAPKLQEGNVPVSHAPVTTQMFWSDSCIEDVKFHWSGGRNAPRCFLSKRLLLLLLQWRIPSRLRSAFWSPMIHLQMWSMKNSLLVFVYIKGPSCPMSQNPDKLATCSNKLSSLTIMSGLAASSTHGAGGGFLTAGEPTRWHTVNHRVARPEWAPPHLAAVISTTLLNTSAGWVTAETWGDSFLLRMGQKSKHLLNLHV